jgi:hypothetical protein
LNSIITKKLIMLKNMVYSWKCKIDESIMMLGIKVGLINVRVVILSIMYVILVCFMFKYSIIL